jgi:WD40 repeat protein
MKFNRIFFKSDDFITAIDVMSTNRNLICCANYSGRIFLYDYAKKIQVVENRLKLQKRKSSTSDTDTFETPHVSALAFSHDGRHLLCGLENGTIITLDPNVLHEVKVLNLSHDRIVAIKFSPDSSFVTLYVRNFSLRNFFT